MVVGLLFFIFLVFTAISIDPVSLDVVDPSKQSSESSVKSITVATIDAQLLYLGGGTSVVVPGWALNVRDFGFSSYGLGRLDTNTIGGSYFGGVLLV